MIQSKPKRRNVFLISAILLVLFLFSYYFFAFIPNKGNDMKNRGIRVMNRMAENIKEKEDHYEKSIELFKCDYKLSQVFEFESDTSLILDNLIYDIDCTDREDLNTIVDTSFAELDRFLTADNDITYERYYILRDSLLIYNGYIEAVTSDLQVDAKVKFISKADSADYLYVQSLEENNNDEDWYADEEWDEYNLSRERAYILGISSDDFLSGIKRFEFFDDIFIVDPTSNEVLDNSKANIKYFNYTPSDSSVIKSDSEVKISGVDISEKTISNTDYYTYTTLIEIQGVPYYLNGLISKKKYNAQVRSVSVWVILISLIVLLFLIQVLPIIKPFLLNKKERLQGSDMLWSAVAMVFGMAALTFFALGIVTFAINEVELVDKKLKLYANNISKDLNQESEKALDILVQYANNPDSKAVEEKAQSFIKKNSEKISFLGIDQKGKTFNYTKVSKSDGYEKIENSLDLSHREYYRIHTPKNSSNVWKASFNKDVDTYFIESIYSLSSGKHETVISTKNKNSIWALVYPFNSVNNVYLEPNYSFCIIDENGTIHYHTDQNKINNENFFEETNNDDNVRSFVRNGSNTSMNIEFSLKDYQAHIQKIKNTPWFVVSMYDIQKSRLSITSSMAITFEFILAILVYLLAMHFLIIIQRKMSKNESNEKFTYYFINPLSTTSSTYKELYIINVAVILYLVSIYISNDINIIANALLYFASITLVILYNYIKLVTKKSDSKSNITFFEIVLFILSSAWSLAYLFSNSSVVWAIPLGVIFILIIKEKFTSKNEKPIKTSNNFFSYYFNVFTWILIFSILPVLLFFKPTYNQQRISRTTRYLQEEFNERIKLNYWEDKKDNLFSTSEFDTLNPSISSQRLLENINLYLYKDGAHLKGINTSETIGATIQKGIDDESQNPFFKITAQPNSAYFNNQPLEPSHITAFSLPSPFSVIGSVFWLFIISVLVLLYQTVIKISEKFFYLDLTRKLKAATPKFFKEYKPIKEESEIMDKEHNILLVGLPYSGRNKIAKAYLKKAQGPIYKIDFLQDLTEVKTEVKARGNGVNKNQSFDCPIIINNFDYRIFNFEENLIRLEILEYILSERNKLPQHNKIILITSLDIYQIIEIYQENIKLLISQKKSENNEIIETQKNTIDRWESALFGFSKHIIPLKGKETGDYLETELSFGNALGKLKPSILSYRNNLLNNAIDLSAEEIEDKVISAIQEHAENYYFSIWNSCSKEEKFLLFDIAQDDMVNSTNIKAVQSLVRKGILLTSPRLKIFNTSFSQFILESISEEESTQMEVEAKKHGTWNTYKYLVIFLVLVIVVFLSFVEEQSFTKITGTVSMGAMLLPKVLQVLNSFTSKKAI